MDVMVEPVDAPVDSPSADAPLDSPTVDAPADAPVDAGCVPTGTGTVDCFALPNGWNVVAFTPMPNVACPTNFTMNPANVDEGPQATGGACTCDTCNVTTQPTCLKGPVGVSFDNGLVATCAIPFTALQNPGSPGGACGRDNYHMHLDPSLDIQFTPPPASGAVCDAPGTAHKNKIDFASKDRICGADSPAAAGCNAAACSPSVPSPFLACIEQAGDNPCPSGPFQVKRLVGDDVTFDCAACGCGVSATCSGTVTYYTDMDCMDNELPMVADGKCHSAGIPQGGAAYDSYKYTATPSNVACAISGAAPSPTNLALTGKKTICCAQ